MKIGHLDQAEPAEAVDVDRPREDEDGLDVEDDEEQRVDVVADVRLAEQRQRVGARFVGDVLLVLRVRGSQQAGRSEHGSDHDECRHHEDGDGQILPVELGHARLRNRPGWETTRSIRGWFFPRAQSGSAESGSSGPGRRLASATMESWTTKGRNGRVAAAPTSAG